MTRYDIAICRPAKPGFCKVYQHKEGGPAFASYYAGIFTVGPQIDKTGALMIVPQLRWEDINYWEEWV